MVMMVMMVPGRESMVRTTEMVGMVVTSLVTTSTGARGTGTGGDVTRAGMGSDGFIPTNGGVEEHRKGHYSLYLQLK